MRFFVAVVMALGLASLPAQQAFACSCAQTTVEDSATFADAVFAGTVVADEPLGGDPAGALAATAPMPGLVGQRIYTFAVDGVAKGDVAAEARVLAGGDGASCGMSFAVGERWLVFAMWDGAFLSTGLCSGNVPLGADEAAPLPLSAAPVGEVPVRPVEVPWTVVGILASLAAVAGISILAFRRA